jgi:alpha-beta hydrolase superfamily lysophospholipase
MSDQDDYQLLDRPEFVQFVFYPRRDHTDVPPNARDFAIEVDEGVSIVCRFYVNDLQSPSILLFHGNGEVVSDHNFIGPIYNQIGANLFVADYRGYGASTGMPGFSTMVADSHRIYTGFLGILREGGYSRKAYVMGRSLGSVSAIELAAHYEKDLKGLIIESGFASTLRLMSRLGFPPELVGIKDPGFPNLTRIRSVHLPTLIIHAEHDSLIPLEQARDLYANVATDQKRLLVIPEADHNDLMMCGMREYFRAIEEFISA